MIAHNPYSDCLNARPYYYDFLSEQSRGDIPPGALDHMTRCTECQGEIGRLKDLFERLDEKQACRRSERDSATIKLLGLHLGYAGEPVTCGTVKLYVASLADPALRIRVETPITRHVDECPACREDLGKLRDMELSHEQLCRLGQVLAVEAEADGVSCSQARAVAGSVASMDFSAANAEVLKHLSTCRECRTQLYLRREKICRELLQNNDVQSRLGCESVSTSDLYDFCLPYGVDPANEDFVVLHEPIASHLRSCPTCMARVQSLHKTIYDIISRPDSGVVTCFTLQEEDDRATTAEAGGERASRRIAMQTPDAEGVADTTSAKVIPVTAALEMKRRVSTLNLKRYAKLAIAAAAVIIIVSVFFSHTPPAQALDPEILRAVKTASNVHIATFFGGATEPRQEQWVSRSLGVSLLKTGETFALASISDGVRKIKESPDAETRIIKLTADDIEVLRKSINGSLGITPFDDASNFPPGSEWTQPPPDASQPVAEGIEVRELTYPIDAGPNRVKFSMWRFFVEAGTSLPQKVQIYRTVDSEDGYKMRSQLEIEYPRESEIEAAIEKAGF